MITSKWKKKLTFIEYPEESLEKKAAYSNCSREKENNKPKIE